MAKTKLKRQKVSMMLDESVIRIINERALREGKTMSDVIQEAVVQYSSKELTELERRREAFKRFTSRPFKITFEEMQELMEWDMYDTESR